MNLYTNVGGKAFELDAIEQMTRDRSTQTCLRYDWRGQLCVPLTEILAWMID